MCIYIVKYKEVRFPKVIFIFFSTGEVSNVCDSFPKEEKDPV